MTLRKNFKKFVILTALAPSLANANHWSNGFYIGANAGLGALQTKNNVAYGMAPDRREIRLSDQNISGDVLLGWCTPIKKWHFGLEISGGGSGLKAKDTSVVDLAADQVDHIIFKEQYNFGAAIKLGGYLVEKTLTYLKLGGRMSRFEGSTQATNAGVVQPIYKKSKTLNAFEVGLGAQMEMSHRWSLFGEYNHAFYNKLEINNPANNANGYPTYRFKPQVGRVNIGIVYHFGR